VTLTRAENALIKGGAVFLMKDEAVVFPEARLEGAGPRNLHEFRWAIVLQGPGDYQALDYPLVHVIPCSSSSTPVRGTFPLPQEELQRDGSPFTAASVLAYTNLVQPCLKTELVRHRGNLLSDTYGRLCAQVVRVLGLVPAVRGNPPTQGGLNLPPRVSPPSSKLQQLQLARDAVALIADGQVLRFQISHALRP
jgi:hypothetical protein